MTSSTSALPASLHTENLRANRWVFVAAAAVAGSFIGVAVLAYVLSGGEVRTMDLLSDPAELAETPWYLGGLSNLTLKVWAGSVALSAIAATGLWPVDRPLARALFWLAGVTAVFTLDDQFLLHEVVFPEELGISENVVYAAYVGLLALAAWKVGPALLAHPDASVLAVGAAAFGCSVGLDVVGWDISGRRQAEEGFKVLGAACWALFPALVVIRTLRRSAVPPVPDRAVAATTRPSGDA